MPYNNISELPDRIKNVLPSHAEEIYLEAFNHALETYKDESKRKSNDSLEEIAQKVAWSAVKKKYVKNESGEWVEIKK
jgi:cation transport regulator